MTFTNSSVTMTQAEFDSLPTERQPEIYRKSHNDWGDLVWLEKSIMGSGELMAYRHIGEPAPCRATGCNCYVGDSMVMAYTIKIEQ